MNNIQFVGNARMGHRLTKIYTKTGDDGTTGLGNNQRVDKAHARVEAYGTVDELNSAIGVVLAANHVSDDIRTLLSRLQHELFELGGELCMPGYEALQSEHVEHLEQALDDLNASLPPLKDFILPGGTLAASYCHLARTICRRAERCIVRVHHHEPLRTEILQYINRLSDLLFVISRVLVHAAGKDEVLWEKKS